MRPLLLFTTLVALFLVGAGLLDERRTSFGALPVQPHATTSSFSPETSGLAIDREWDTLWIAEQARDSPWRVTFDEPVDLIGLSIDTGFNKRRGAKSFRARLIGPDGDVRRFSGPRVERELVFSCWHVYRRKVPFTTQAVELEIKEGATRSVGEWALRNVRFLVAQSPERAMDAAVLRTSLREAALPFAIGVLWIVLLLRARAGGTPS